MKFLALLLASSLVLGGCVQGGETQDTGHDETARTDEPASSITVEPEPGIRVAENRGAIRGRVINDVSLPVSGVFVTLGKTSLFANTNDTGQFLMRDIVPGAYSLRAERSGFQTAQAEVEVRAANVTVVELVLVPHTDAAMSGRPHLHDFWGDNKELLLMDHDVDLTKDPGSGYGAVPYPILSRVYYPNTNQTNPPGWPIFLPEEAENGAPAMILPGTGKLVTTFTWSTPDVVLDKLGLAYATPFDTVQRAKLLPVVASGVPQELTINATIADTGHQKFSLWQFWVHANNPATASGYKPAVVTGRIHVKMVLVKADVLLEPEHPDHWADGDVIVLHNKSKPYRVPVGSTPLVLRDNYDGWTLPNERIVPPGAKRMRIELAWTYPQDGAVLNFEHDLIWRTGDQPPRATPRSQFHTAPPKENTPGATGKKVWEFELQPEWTDTFYQRKSNWLFSLSLKPQPDGSGYHLEPRPHDATLEVTVWKDPAYATG